MANDPILVVQLQRLGDILMSVPALQRIQRNNPNREIHLLVNEQFKFVKPLLPMVNRWFYFDRNFYQRQLGEAKFPFYSPFNQVERDLKEVFKTQYHQVFNFSHNRLSADILQKIKTEEKVGMTATESGYRVFGSAFRVLNSSQESLSSQTLHYSDFLNLSVGGEEKAIDYQITLQESEELAELRSNIGDKYIVIQPFSAEDKKCVRAEALVEIYKTFATLNESHKFVLLGAPFEKNQLSEIYDMFPNDGRVFMSTLDLPQASLLLKEAAVLFTPDTSIKHLAALVDTPTLELSLGSANPAFTGAYSSKALSIFPKSPCFPCPHSEDCSQPSRVCEESIPIEAVALTLFKMVDQPSDIQVVSAEFSDKIEIWKTHITKFGHFCTSVGTLIDSSSFENILVRWMDWLSCTSRDSLDTKAGSLAIEFYNMVVNVFGRSELEQLGDHVNSIMSRYVALLSDLQANVGDTDYSKLYFDQKRTLRQVEFLKAFIDELQWQTDFQVGIEQPGDVNLQTVRQLQNETSNIKYKLEFGLKILRNLQTSIMEASYGLET